MEGQIDGEDGEYLKIFVTDNNLGDHDITIEIDTGEIVYHQCDAYADDPADRTQEENEHNEQARRYAKYYVYSERGYDTVEHTENPDYINAVREAIADLSLEAFGEYFGPLYQQLQSHNDPGVQRLVSLPAGVRSEDAVVYEFDVYLGVDLDEGEVGAQARTLAREHGLDFAAGTATPITEATASEIADWEEFGADLLERTEPGTISLDVGAVSGIHVGFPNARGEHEVQEADSPLDRQADARVELMPVDPGTIEEFRALLDHHLRSQVRDTIAGMGLMPPEPFQTIGFGKMIYARRYDQYDLYPAFHTGESESGGFLSNLL